MAVQPALFLSHGSPAIVITPTPARTFLTGLGRWIEGRYGLPRAVLIASAHWETDAPRIALSSAPETIHDFRGFPDALYKIRYSAPGATDVARTALDWLRSAGFAAEGDEAQGLDHGAWIPMALIWPDGSVPVAQISIQPHHDPAHHAALGRALADMRRAGVLLIGSGSAVHNLPDSFQRMQTGATDTPAWAKEFSDWIDDRLAAGDTQALMEYRARAPHAAHAHPTDEHLLPLFFAYGAGAENRAHKIHDSFEYGSLGMQAWAFDQA